MDVQKEQLRKEAKLAEKRVALEAARVAKEKLVGKEYIIYLLIDISYWNDLCYL